jgi:hypothetical protein
MSLKNLQDRVILAMMSKKTAHFNQNSQNSMQKMPTAFFASDSAISHQPSAISHQPSAISHQPSAISHQPSAISHQPSAISHQPSVHII